jgi:hypothetical protein
MTISKLRNQVLGKYSYQFAKAVARIWGPDMMLYKRDTLMVAKF